MAILIYRELIARTDIVELINRRNAESKNHPPVVHSTVKNPLFHRQSR